ncbi:reverse transcriptase-like protein [Novosphingobium sp. PASSN1]|uniref:reverse transcriptase-like protein n=1 Tax=Novosphingobium sp. PASSN1 TaxID=2015561 RepID=UPI000BCCE153|nr:reverse transcriptase-like protein [Novosphingobium sp. PASSN1]OYU36995.1 MAG: ribonuclease HI [Novosphingobium sp. PASSN1]
MPEQALKLFFDGGCRPNPGLMETAVVARGRVWHRPAIGHGTNDHAEWQALLDALDVARELGAQDIVLLGDSTLVVAQASGALKPRAAFAAFHARFEEQAARFARVRIRRIKRAQNLAGIALAKAWPR